MKSIDQYFDVRKELGLADLPNEIWKDIPGYEDFYQVSNLGRVKSLERYVFSETAVYSCYLKKEKILRQSFNINGYLIVGLSRDKHSTNFFVHRLVATAFIQNKENKPQIDHINAVKTDNRVKNLRWVSASENIRNPLTYSHLLGSNNPFYGKTHSVRTRKIMSQRHADVCGSNNPAARKVINLDTGAIFDTVTSAASFFGKSDNTLRAAIKKKRKFGSYYWGYYSKNGNSEVSI